MRSERFLLIRDVLLAALASLLMVIGYSGWLLSTSRPAHPLPIVTLPSYHPVCNFQYPYGFAPHRITVQWEHEPV